MTNDGEAHVRSADQADATVIAQVHMSSRLATMPYLPPQTRSSEQVTDWVRGMLKNCQVLVAVRSHEIVGYAALERDVLKHLYLRPDVRRQGIGTLLLDEVRRRSPGGVKLHVFQQNIEARAFYKRHGFIVCDTSDGERNMEHLPDVTLRWRPDGAP